MSKQKGSAIFHSGLVRSRDEKNVSVSRTLEPFVIFKTLKM